MNDLHFNAQQQAVLDAEINTHIFLEGPFKSGKTTLGVARLQNAAAQSDPSHQILVLNPAALSGSSLPQYSAGSWFSGRCSADHHHPLRAFSSIHPHLLAANCRKMRLS